MKYFKLHFNENDSENVRFDRSNGQLKFDIRFEFIYGYFGKFAWKFSKNS